MSRRSNKVLTLDFGFALVAAACGSDDDGADAPAETTADEPAETTADEPTGEAGGANVWDGEKLELIVAQFSGLDLVAGTELRPG
jgi:hypothetical protein